MKCLSVTTSWDDGQITDLKLAKLLTQYGIKGTFYITKTYGDPLGKQGVIEIDREHEMGAHTLSHLDLLSGALSIAEREIEGSKTYAENIVGLSTSMFCYPYGRYSQTIKKLEGEWQPRYLNVVNLTGLTFSIGRKEHTENSTYALPICGNAFEGLLH